LYTIIRTSIEAVRCLCKPSSLGRSFPNSYVCEKGQKPQEPVTKRLARSYILLHRQINCGV